MKIALCFYGLVGSINDKNGNGIPLDPSIAYDYYKKNIFNENDTIDIFIHSYSISAKEKLLNLYNPVDYIIENQVNFPQSENHPSINNRYAERLKMLFLKIFKKTSYLNYITLKNGIF